VKPCCCWRRLRARRGTSIRHPSIGSRCFIEHAVRLSDARAAAESSAIRRSATTRSRHFAFTRRGRSMPPSNVRWLLSSSLAAASRTARRRGARAGQAHSGRRLVRRWRQAHLRRRLVGARVGVGRRRHWLETHFGRTDRHGWVGTSRVPAVGRPGWVGRPRRRSRPGRRRRTWRGEPGCACDRRCSCFRLRWGKERVGAPHLASGACSPP